MIIDLGKIKKIYMIGVKGVGMTMLAQYLRAKGIEITGSDIPDVFMTDEVLKKEGVKIIEEFSEDNINNDYDLIIYSTAYNEKTNVEVAKALNLNLATYTYAEILGQIFKDSYGIAVVGSHGKTTTSAWLAYVMDKSRLSPSAMVGARVPQFEGNGLFGTSDYLVVEADEYNNKLQYYQPRAILLNNIDYDHPDQFKTEKDYEKVFKDFVQKIPKNGFIVSNFDDPKVKRMSELLNTRVLSYAINEFAEYVAYDIKQDAELQYFKVKLNLDDDEINDLGEFSIKLAGKHNISNALAVIAASIELDIPLSEIRTHLEGFEGTARRMEEMGKYRGALIIDDYAHHPTEIETTIDAIKNKYPDKNLITVFHPHTFTRTKGLLDDFSLSFDKTDSLVILDIYGSAREEQGGVHSKDLIRKINKHNPSLKVEYQSTLDDAEEYLRGAVNKNDLVLLMGAGDIFRVGENLLK